MDKDFEFIMNLLPHEAGSSGEVLGKETERVSEIRIRSDKAITFTTSDGLIQSKVITDSKMVESIFLRLCGNSVFAHQEDIKNGFITVSGGIRVGICGTAIISDGKIKNIDKITGLNIRIARNIKNISREIIPYILTDGGINNTLIFGPPLSGKTTILKDLIFQLSGVGKKVAVIDERRELYTVREESSNADFFIGYPRSLGIEQAIRCFSPDIIIFDELGNSDDIAGLYAAEDTGVAVITTAHGKSIEKLKRRRLLRKVIEERFFDIIIELGSGECIGRIDNCYKGSENL